MRKKKLTLLERYQEWIAKYKASGDAHKLVSYDCPHCSKAIETPKPDKNAVNERGCWDSVTTCPHCEKVHFKEIYPTGRVKIKPLAELNNELVKA